MSKVLCLSAEPDLAHQVTTLFSELRLLIECTSSVKRLLDCACNEQWRATVLDLDLIDEAEIDSTIAELRRHVPNLALISRIPMGDLASIAKRHQAIQLHKPASAGEVGLVISKMLKNGQIH